MNKPCIAYLGPEIPALSATFIYEELLGLERRGVSILPFSVRRPSHPAAGQEGLTRRTQVLYEGSMLARLVEYALVYYRDFIAPKKQFRAPDATERAALDDLAATLRATPVTASAEELQNLLYDIGKRHPFAELRGFFAGLYQVLLGQPDGPRFGQFIALYGVAETVALIETRLAEPA